MKSATFETDFSDHHKLITTILRKAKKIIPKKCSTEITRDLTKRNLKLKFKTYIKLPNNIAKLITLQK